MKKKDFNDGNQIGFKALADKIDELADPSMLSEDELLYVIQNILPGEISKLQPSSEEELYDEIVDNFFFVINELGVENFDFFRFSSLDYCLEIIIDGKEYDLDGEFTHDDEDATGALCAIESLASDIVCEYDKNYEDVLRKVQMMINIRNSSK